MPQSQLQSQKILVTAKAQLKRFVAVNNVCIGLYIYKTRVRYFLSESPLYTDTPIIRTFWYVPLVSILTGSQELNLGPLDYKSDASNAILQLLPSLNTVNKAHNVSVLPFLQVNLWQSEQLTSFQS